RGCQGRNRSGRALMRPAGRLIAGAAAPAAALSVVGLTATAQAQPNPKADPPVVKGVATAVNLPACPAGNTVTSVTPAPPGTVQLVKNGNKSKLAGVWTATGSTQFTVHCSGGGPPPAPGPRAAPPHPHDRPPPGARPPPHPPP